MTEEEARDWLDRELYVPRETIERIGGFIDHLRAQAERQNLIARSTFDTIWARHVVDSAQLVPLMRAGRYLDLGSGAGFPGLIVAALTAEPGTLVDSRRMRVDFLEQAARVLGVSDRVTIIRSRVETLPQRTYDVITARAFAPLATLFQIAHRLSHADTLWLLPKGKSAQVELADARRSWQGDFRVVPSVTDPESAIVIAANVRPRRAR